MHYVTQDKWETGLTFHLKAGYLRKSVMFKFEYTLIFHIITYGGILPKFKNFAFYFVHIASIQCSLITNPRLCLLYIPGHNSLRMYRGEKNVFSFKIFFLTTFIPKFSNGNL